MAPAMILSYLALLAALLFTGFGFLFLKRSEHLKIRLAAIIAILFFAMAAGVIIFVSQALPVDNIYAIVTAACMFIAIRIGMRYLK